MISAAQFLLLCGLVTSGYASFACLWGEFRRKRTMIRSGVWAAVLSVGSLTGLVAILIQALLVKDFRFAYVAQYSSRLLPWHYSVSALWVGQAGSLLLWAWLLGVLALLFRFVPRRGQRPLREPTFGALMGCLAFLVAVMVFGADPTAPSASVPAEGAGLSPLLQHPAMLIHPPVVFLGYAGWAIPCAIALAALTTGNLDAGWIEEARPWALLSWLVLGVGILLGANWAYEELGWGGYWGWDPVENGSLIPWLTGTAMIHTAMAWRQRGILKKTALGLAVATFALCNFSTFLTRSGIFSSLHAFSTSPIGWMFLALMIALAGGGAALSFLRRDRLCADGTMAHLWTRETLIVCSTASLLLLAATAVVGTLSVPLSDAVLGRKVLFGPPFYNSVLMPTGLVLLAATAAAPLLRWGKPPSPALRKTFLVCGVVGMAGAAAALMLGARHPVGVTVAALVVFGVAALAACLLLDADARPPQQSRIFIRGYWIGGLKALARNRRTYAGFLAHLGFICLAVGVTGSSLGSRRLQTQLTQGESSYWAGRSVRLAGLRQRREPDKHIVEALLHVTPGNGSPYELRPAQHFHVLQQDWTTEVAIHSTWRGDFYTILHNGDLQTGQINLTLVENPLVRWIWMGGWIMAAAVVWSLWPSTRGAKAATREKLSGPHADRRRRTGSRSTATRHVPATKVGSSLFRVEP